MLIDSCFEVITSLAEMRIMVAAVSSFFIPTQIDIHWTQTKTKPFMIPRNSLCLQFYLTNGRRVINRLCSISDYHIFILDLRKVYENFTSILPFKTTPKK